MSRSRGHSPGSFFVPFALVAVSAPASAFWFIHVVCLCFINSFSLPPSLFLTLPSHFLYLVFLFSPEGWMKNWNALRHVQKKTHMLYEGLNCVWGWIAMNVFDSVVMTVIHNDCCPPVFYCVWLFVLVFPCESLTVVHRWNLPAATSRQTLTVILKEWLLKCLCQFSGHGSICSICSSLKVEIKWWITDL